MQFGAVDLNKIIFLWLSTLIIIFLLNLQHALTATCICFRKLNCQENLDYASKMPEGKRCVI